MSVHEHKERGKKNIRFFVVTVSDTRDESTDTSGQTIRNLLQDNQHEISGYRIVKDEPEQIENVLNEVLAKDDVDAVIVNGGTGIAPRDGTYEVVSRFLEKKLDGFGEIFRYLSYLDIGSAAIMVTDAFYAMPKERSPASLRKKMRPANSDRSPRSIPECMSSRVHSCLRRWPRSKTIISRRSTT